MTDPAFQKCINPDCAEEFDCGQVLFKCPQCGELLDAQYNWGKIQIPDKLSDLAKRWANRNNPLDFSGVWRFRELLNFCEDKYKVTIGEGQTILQQNDAVAKYVDIKQGCLYLQYEGLNPSGSFKDNGMAAAFSHAKMLTMSSCACASTGNTSASVALYAHHCGLKCTVLIGSGRIAFGKLSQAMDYGAQTIQILGDFDDCMRQVQDVCSRLGLYLLNSLNPFRLEGQKTIMYRIIEQLGWDVPDWIIVPGGNLGNSSAFGKAFFELKQLGLIKRIPRMAVINAGDPNYISEPNETDLDGSPRIIAGRIDMGAYESNHTRARLWIFPRLIYRYSQRQRRVLAWLRLPKGVTEDQIDSNTPLLLYPGQIEPTHQYIFPRGRRPKRVSIIAYFDKPDLMDVISNNGRVELKLVGRLKTGRYFYGTDTIRIINRRPPPRPWRSR